MKKTIRLVLVLTIFQSCVDGNQVEPVQKSTDSRNPSIAGTIISDRFENLESILFIHEEADYVGAFSNIMLDGTELVFSTSDKAWPIIFTDNEGNEWDCFGEAVLGPRQGERLNKFTTTTGYWFSIANFYPVPDIYGFPEETRLEENTDFGEWVINPEKVVAAQTPDAIPALTDPIFDLVTRQKYQQNYFDMQDADLVTVVKHGGTVKIYPNKILDWHEVVNDKIEDLEIVLSYCPLTGTADVWDANLDGQRANFGVSGLLYKSNLILFDRSTSSYWSQLKRKAVHGEFIGESPNEIGFFVMNWAAVEALLVSYNVLVLSRSNTSRDYNFYPYGEYKDVDEFLLFPVEYPDNRIPAKEVVTAIIIEDKAKAYRF